MKTINWTWMNEQVSRWIRQYAEKNGIQCLVVGVSGGIDSALVSYLCAKTGLTTYVVNIPIKQSTSSAIRAKDHIIWLKENFTNVVDFHVDLTEEFEMLNSKLNSSLSVNSNLCSANLRSRMRMETLYHLAGAHRGIVVGTGNKVEDFGVGFFTKWGDGGVDISPIAGFMKSEVGYMAKVAGIIEKILKAVPSDDLWDNGATDEDQIGASYKHLEWAMEMQGAPENNLSEKGKKVMSIYNSFNTKNAHKMNPIPVFDADSAFIESIGYRPSVINTEIEDPEITELYN